MVSYTMAAHTRWKGVDGGEYTVCQASGLSRVEKRLGVPRCAGCGFILQRGSNDAKPKPRTTHPLFAECLDGGDSSGGADH
jgi:hypothetical protein